MYLEDNNLSDYKISWTHPYLLLPATVLFFSII